MTILWFIYATIDMFRPLDKQIQGGDESAGYSILIIPCLIIDCILVSIFH